MIKVIINGKTYNWDVGEEEAKNILAKYGATKIGTKSEIEIKSFIDPYTVGLLIGGGAAGAIGYILYRLNQKEMSEFKKEYKVS